MIALQEEKKNTHMPVASIKVIGVGGAGGNTVNSIIESGYQAIEFIVANTDSQALELSKAQNKVQIGIKSTKGLGTGADPSVGKRAAEEDLDKVMEAIGEADIVFLAAGMGGGTGSGALPVIARALKERNILSIAVVTKPFLFEGKRRMRVAQNAIEELRTEVDTLITLPNQKLLDLVDQKVSMIDAFSMINEVLGQSVRGISDIISRPGHINVDFADVRTIMKDRGMAVMGTGKASGDDRAMQAALAAISSPLLENMSIEGAHSVLLNITGGRSLGLHEISQAAEIIYEQAHEDANIILGSVIDETLQEEVVVTIIATGFDEIKQEIKKEKEPIVHVRATVLDRSEIEVVSKENEKTEEPQQKLAATEKSADAKVSDLAEALSDRMADKKEVKEKKEEKIEETCAAKKDEQAPQLPIDKSDLDVPTFMRNKADECDKDLS